MLKLVLVKKKMWKFFFNFKKKKGIKWGCGGLAGRYRYVGLVVGVPASKSILHFNTV